MAKWPALLPSYFFSVRKIFSKSTCRTLPELKVEGMASN